MAGGEQFAVGAQLQSDADEEVCAVAGAEIPEVSVSACSCPITDINHCQHCHLVVMVATDTMGLSQLL